MRTSSAITPVVGTTRHWLLGVVALSTVYLAGCEESAPIAAGMVTRADSAGIAIVTSPPDAAAGLELAATPRVAIGRLDGPEELQLYRVVGARRLSDGRLAVANAGSHEIRLFDETGRYLSSMGGEGEGPGEFTGMARLDVSAEDSLYVWDQQQQRLTVFDPEGGFARDLKLQPPAEGTFPNYAGRFSDGTLMAAVGLVLSQPPEDGTVVRRETAIVRYDAVGQVGDTLAAFRTRGFLVKAFGSGGGFAVYSVPFDPGTAWAIVGRGLIEAYGPRFEVRARGADGGVARIARVAREPIPVDARLRRAAVDAELEGRTNPEALDNAREAYDGIEFPEFVAAYDHLVSDDAGGLWARQVPLPGDERASWDVLDETGALVGAVSLPESMTVWQVGADFVVVSDRDELEVERVAVYDVVPAS